MRKNRLGVYILVFIASLVAISFLLPIIWMVLTSFKGDIEALLNQSILPQEWITDNYAYAVSSGETMPIGRWFFNSIFVATISTILVIIFDVLAAYAFARIDFKGRGLIMSLLVATLMIPGIVTLIPAFKLYANLGLINTYIPLIIPYTINVFGIFLLYSFIKDYPRELEEAATIDGASQLTILRKVVFPAIKPVVATLAIITFMGCYNDYLWPLLVTNSAEMRTITTGIAIVNQGAFATQYGKLMAMTVLATIPVIIVFIFGQKHIVKGITQSGIK